METAAKKKLYEAMFLVDSAQTTDWDKIIATLGTVLKRADGEIVSMRKWDERKLAYEIDGKTRGTYILSYFRADSGKVREIEKAVQLSEQIMRVLILSAETSGKEDVEKETRAMKAEEQKTEHHAGEKDEAGQLSDKKQTEEAVNLVE